MLGRVAAFIPVVLAVAAAGAGWWLLGGLVLAACLAYCAQRAGLPRIPAAQDGPPSGSVRLRTALRVASAVAVLAVCAAMFGAYTVPGLGPLGPVALVLLVVVARVAGVTIPAELLRWGGGLLVVAGLVFVAVCFAVAPAQAVTAPNGGGPSGVLFAAAVALPMFAGGGVLLRSWRLALAAGLGLLVAVAALYQSGPFRLGLAPTSMRDVLAAADAQLLVPVLAVVIGLATLGAAVAAMEAVAEVASDSAPDVRGRLVTAVPAGLPAAVLAVALGPAAALVLAAVLTLAEVLTAGMSLRTPTGRVTVVLTALLLAGLSLPLLS
ncbi:hypothetical protein SAMN05216266_10942 [Amycolatopsis marina]|uniref:Uncharacterized protein n=1 Tax=Amycolatopsis marina TaxID=490629 RepID=A0A1I1ADS2_9PSEU|nr:hypothetical protein [Amycolatopsis marina]SFB36155.1 hypothetical protein SAMN05216266_10942 [Amycolatopsis marina]